MVSGSDNCALSVSSVWPGFGRSAKDTGCKPSTPAGLETSFSDFPAFEIDGDIKSALRLEAPLFGVLFGVNPSSLHPSTVIQHNNSRKIPTCQTHP